MKSKKLKHSGHPFITLLLFTVGAFAAAVVLASNDEQRDRETAAWFTRIFKLGNSTAVTVNMTSPSNGSTVSNTIQLTATAVSTSAPIHHVEFYVDGVLFQTVTNQNIRPYAPSSVMVAKVAP